MFGVSDAGLLLPNKGSIKIATTNPTIYENLPKGTIWVNEVSGEIFVCIDDTPDNNIWQGQLGTKIDSIVDIVDIFRDNSGIALFQFEGNANDTGGQFSPSNGSGTPQYITPSNFPNDSSAFNKALYLDGNSDIDYSPCDGLITSPLTLSIFINTTITGKAIYGHNYEYPPSKVHYTFELYTNSDGTASFYFYDGAVRTLNSNVNVCDGKWHHILFTGADNSECSLWVDGVKVANITTTGPLQHDPNWHFTIGSNTKGGKYVGYIDQFRIFNRVLSDTEIQQLYNEK